jgi:sec-independent protein translocase protein TatA
MNTLAIGMPGGSEIIIILVIILLLFGAKKLPELSRSLGRSLGEFKKGKEDLERELREVQDDLHKAATEPEPTVEAKPVAETGPKEEKPTKTEPA